MKAKWAFIAILGALVAWGLSVWLRPPEPTPHPAPATSQVPNFNPPAEEWQPSETADAGSPPSVQETITQTMAGWRLAILNRDSDAVLQIDATFADQPKLFEEALVTCAQTDAEERVRAFCTRVLGKLKLGAPKLFEGLLKDKSEYVRFNAAWALGQINAKQSLPSLNRAFKVDKSAQVRQAAEQSLKMLR